MIPSFDLSRNDSNEIIPTNTINEKRIVSDQCQSINLNEMEEEQPTQHEENQNEIMIEKEEEYIPCKLFK